MIWEYKVVKIDGYHGMYQSGWKEVNPYQLDNGEIVTRQRIWAHIDELGKDGWELVAVVFECDSEGVAFFKREIGDEAQ